MLHAPSLFVFTSPGLFRLNRTDALKHSYAKALDLDINARPEDRGFLQFADGTFQETVGQVNTTWTFADGLKIPVTFEVLENSSADVILGEEVLWEYNVFQTYATTRQGVPYENDGVQVSDLAPFSYQKHWQRKARHLKYQILSVFNSKLPHPC